MRCCVYKCRENECGYCKSPDYVEIDEDGICELMYVPTEGERRDGDRDG